MPKKKKKKSTTSSSPSYPAVVGPDYVQVLRGTFLSKSVALILCGESHEDAVDVTRQSGVFVPKEGWVDVTAEEVAKDLCAWHGLNLPRHSPDGGNGNDGNDDDDPMGDGIAELPSIRHRILRRHAKTVTLAKAKEWGAALVERDMDDEMGHVLLAWIPESTPLSTSNGGGRRGGGGKQVRGAARLITVEVDFDDSDDNDDDDEVGGGRSNEAGIAEEKKGRAAFLRRRRTNSDTGKGGGGGGDGPDGAVSTLVKRIGDLCLGSSSSTTTDEEGTGGGETTAAAADQPVLFLWTDLDAEARDLNLRRLCDIDIPYKEHDDFIKRRKAARRTEENLCAWDDWFVEARGRATAASHGGNDGVEKTATTVNGGKKKTPEVHLVLEASIPPWEVELHTPSVEPQGGGSCTSKRLGPAADCIRCLSEDSDPSTLDEHDPASDGFGSYLDFIYRRFMDDQAPSMAAEERPKPEAVRSEGENGGATTTVASAPRQWLHCVDSRDLGCEHACVAESLHKMWLGLLPQNIDASFGTEDRECGGDDRPALHLSEELHNDHQLVEFNVNPERMELQSLREKGMLTTDNRSVDDDRKQDGNGPSNDGDGLITFPSFEGFFGQNTDIMYYSPHVRVAYSPFLANNVGSLSNWEEFFSRLFFGGTIPDAMSRLKLKGGEGHDETSTLHVRSPILKVFDLSSGEYHWHRRNDDEHDVTFPHLPAHCHLTARGTAPPRTWSSQLFHALAEEDGRVECRDAALAARQWALDAVQRNASDPKGSDDEHGGGEWFLAYLRAAHRDIYDDIDRSDHTALLHKKYAAGEGGGKPRHNIGRISVPSCRDGFEEISEGMMRDRAAMTDKERPLKGAGKVVTRRMETMANILIDIWMSQLVDFSSLLKIFQIIASADSDKVVVVCYMGSVHTRAIGEFCCKKMNFSRKIFEGNLTWDDEAARTLHLPPSLWRFEELF